ncbi:MAG: hypothetical protein QW594_03210 [Candidatus Woesearchaeota archaeon]
MLSKHEKIKISLEMGSYLLLSWLSLYLYYAIGFKIERLFDVSHLLQTITQAVIPIVIILVALGIATALLLIALRHFEKKQAITYGLASSVLAVLPGFFLFYDLLIFYGFIFAFYILGVGIAAAKITDELEDNWHHSFHIGWQYLRKIILLSAVGAFIGSFLMISFNPVHYQDSLTASIERMALENAKSISKEQVYAMLLAQDEAGSAFMLSKQDFKELLDALYTPLTVDEYVLLAYPTFNQMPIQEQQMIKERLAFTLNSNEYIAAQEKLKEQKLDALYAKYQAGLSAAKPDLAIAADEIYQRMQSPAYQQEVASLSSDLIREMPLFQVLFGLLPILTALTIFTFIMLIELVASFFAGLVFMLHYAMYKSKLDRW